MGTPTAEPPARRVSDIEYAAHQLANGLARAGGMPVGLIEARIERERAIAGFFTRLGELAEAATDLIKHMVEAELEERAATRERTARYRQ